MSHLPSGLLSAEVFRCLSVCRPHVIGSVSERNRHGQLRRPVPAPLCAHGEWVQLSRTPGLHRLRHGKLFWVLNYRAVLTKQHLSRLKPANFLIQDQNCCQQKSSLRASCGSPEKFKFVH